MNLAKNNLLLILVFFTSVIFSQEIKKTIPVSIYTNNAEFTDLISTFNIHKKLNLTSYKFMFLAVKNLEEGNFNISFYNINSPSMYIYETYTKVYQTAQLQRSFFKVSDLYNIRSKNQF
ncbi:hypothetical protein [Lutibacter sp.]|uniref:hypothetical protein n=1 Tax=Lutibacter sp. TaxID=1925666 RepID=UPI001A1A0306|nr:hypothetical protein [Lutibacter sp.]MBI9040161.1 hypothetical protein [Lutibacter sp.]